MNDTRRTRIAHVTLGLDMGGQEKLLVEFARHADIDEFAERVPLLPGSGIRGPSMSREKHPRSFAFTSRCPNLVRRRHFKLRPRAFRMGRTSRAGLTSCSLFCGRRKHAEDHA